MYQQVQANSSDMIEPTKMSNYTIDGEPSAEGTRRLIQPETGDVVHQKEMFVIRDNKMYFLFFGHISQSDGLQVLLTLRVQ